MARDGRAVIATRPPDWRTMRSMSILDPRGRPLLLAVGVALAACGGERGREGPATRPAPVSVAAAPRAASCAGGTAEASPVLVRGRGDLDGLGGDEALSLHSDGSLRAGAVTGRAEVTGGTEYFMKKQAELRVVEVDRARGVRALLVALPTDAEEDPDNRYQLFIADGCALRRVLDLTVGGYGVTEVVFPGDGTASYVEDGWTACERAHFPGKPVARQEIVLRLVGGDMVESARRASAQTQDCGQLAACPFVYRVEGGEVIRVGEILRDLRGAGAYALQPLALAAGQGGVMHLRLSEEKPEVTSLDEIYLEVDGQRIAPRECAAAPAPAFCAADHRMHRMGRGDTLDLTFDATGPATLYARGFYVTAR